MVKKTEEQVPKGLKQVPWKEIGDQVYYYLYLTRTHIPVNHFNVYYEYLNDKFIQS